MKKARRVEWGDLPKGCPYIGVVFIGKKYEIVSSFNRKSFELKMEEATRTMEMARLPSIQIDNTPNISAKDALAEKIKAENSALREKALWRKMFRSDD